MSEPNYALCLTTDAADRMQEELRQAGFEKAMTIIKNNLLPHLWQPISKAPRDGTKIDGYNAYNGERHVTWFYNPHNELTHWTNFDGNWGNQPTHWQPLPTPSSGSEGE